ncbi:MAG TPA: phage portal protein [Lachnospiraceae bacterium]|nr:phage portal protein [Lachnospiraceae bacterium]
MGLFDRLRSAFSNKRIAGVELMTQVGNNYVSWNGTVYNSDIVRSCIRPKVKAVGKLVAKHLRETIEEDGSVDLKVNPSNAVRFLLDEPNPLMTGQMLQEKLATQLCLNSNAFALIVRDDYGTPMEIYPIAPRTAEAIYTDAGALLLKFTMPNNRIYTFPYEDIIHLRQDYNENDIFGTPIAPVLVPLLDVVTTTDQGVINAIKNSSVVRWLLKFTNSMRPDDMKSQAKQFAENFLATSEGTGVAAVDAKADAVQINPHDYVPNAAVMDRTTKRIFDLFNTNAAIVSSNYTEEIYNSYFDAEVEPVLIQLGGEYTRKLFTRRERVFGNRIVFEASSWDSASISTKLNLMAMVDRGAMTPNEWRATFNLAPVPGGDNPIRRLDTALVETEETETEGGNADAN